MLKKSLKFEMLEQRRVLTGSVTAELVDGELTITGDRDDNQVVVSQNGPDIVVEGQEGTEINGANGPAFFLASDVVDLVVNMKQGDDQLRMSGEIQGNLTIDTDNGNDVVELGFLSVGGDLDIDTRQGADQVGATNGPVEVGGQATIRTRQGDDQVHLFSDDLGFGGDLTIDTGQGDDGVYLAAGFLGSITLDIGGDLAVSTGQGNDTVRLFASNLFFAPPPSQVSVGGSMRIDLGQGEDTFETESFNLFGEISIMENVEINAGQGNDLVTLAPLIGTVFVVGNLCMDGGQGNDGPFGSTVLGAVTVLGETNVTNFESGV